MSMIERLVLMSLASCLMTSESVSWPGGTYGIPKPTAGCPSADGFQWQQGWRSQDSDGDKNANNANSGSFHVDAVVDDKLVNRSFCIKTDPTTDTGNVAWPPGQYCIYKRERCPRGLKEGFVFWDDDDVDGSSINNNNKGGTLPDGIYNHNTKINFCCRTDGRKSHPVLLPTQDPFLLLAYGSEKCQMIKWTVATQEWIRYDTENCDNTDRANGTIPYRGGQRHPTIHYCYYQGCNKTLTGVNGTFNSPIYRTEEPVVLYCSWTIKVAPAQQILVTFTNFSLQSAGNNDNLLVYDGKDATREVLGVFYKGRPPPKEGINSSSNHMVVVFKSINHTKYTGFVASYFAIKNSVSPTSTSSSSGSSNTTSHIRTQATPYQTRNVTQKQSKESQQIQKSRSTVIIYGPLIGVLVVALIALLVYIVWIRKCQRNYRENETLELTLGSYVNKAVNIEPLKSQTENHLDITETSFGRSEETNISDNSSHTRPQKPEISITDEDFQNKYSLEKRPSTLDCLNRSLKGLSINPEGEINVQLAVKVSKDKR